MTLTNAALASLVLGGVLVACLGTSETEPKASRTADRLSVTMPNGSVHEALTWSGFQELHPGDPPASWVTTKVSGGFLKFDALSNEYVFMTEQEHQMTEEERDQSTDEVPYEWCFNWCPGACCEYFGQMWTWCGGNSCYCYEPEACGFTGGES